MLNDLNRLFTYIRDLKIGCLLCLLRRTLFSAKCELHPPPPLCTCAPFCASSPSFRLPHFSSKQIQPPPASTHPHQRSTLVLPLDYAAVLPNNSPQTPFAASCPLTSINVKSVRVWCNLDGCGILCVLATWAMMLFSVYVVAFVLLRPTPVDECLSAPKVLTSLAFIALAGKQALSPLLIPS